MNDIREASGRTYEIWGNWKMNPPSVDEAHDLLGGILNSFEKDVFHERLMKLQHRIGIGIFVPHIYIPLLGEFMLAQEDYLMVRDFIGIGAQNMYDEPKGAFTGEHSPLMIKDVLVYINQHPTVLIGHSERRQYFGETDEIVNKKMKAAYRYGMRPFMAIGETQGEREDGLTEDVLEEQIRDGLEGIPAEVFLGARTVIAYEPVWAIGTGKTATPEMANEAHAFIRRVIGDKYGADVAGMTSIQYGGSMKPENAADLLAQEHIDGGLIGGASLNAAAFMGIVSAVPLFR